MIVSILDFILLFIAIKKYTQRSYVAPLVIFSFFVTDGFIISFVGIEPVIKHLDFAFLQMVITSVLLLFRDKSVFNVKNDNSGKIIYIYITFFLLQFIRTTIVGLDTFKFALTDIRLWFIPFSYFIFKRIDLYSFQKAGKIIFGFTVFSSFLYVIQYFTHIELVNTYIATSGNHYRMQITPAFLEFFILYLFFYKNRIKYKYLYLGLFMLVLFLSQNRTPIISIALLSAIFLILSRNMKFTIIAIILTIAIIPFFGRMFESRSTEEASFLNKDTFVMMKTLDYANLQKENTFYFRIAILLERGKYLINHPEIALIGVGAIHEDSPHNNFRFITGTGKSDGPDRIQLHSIDIMWCSPLIQFGVLGILLICFVLLYCIKILFKNKSDYVQMIAFLVFIGFLIKSFSSNSLGFSYNLFFMSIMLAYNYKYNIYSIVQKKKKLPNRENL